MVNDHFCSILRDVRSAQQAEITRFGLTSIGSPEHSVRSTGGCTTPTHGPPRVPLLQRRTTIPTSDQTPVEGWALHTHPHQPPTYHARLPLFGLPSSQTQVQGLPLLLLEQSAAVQSPPPVVSVRVRFPVQLLVRQHEWPRCRHVYGRPPARPAEPSQPGHTAR